MSAPELRFHPEATEELLAAAAWYLTRGPGLDEAFEAQVRAAVERILEAPHRWPAYDAVHRKVATHRFPYLVIYREWDRRIWIMAVAHVRQRPAYWRHRQPTDA